MEAPMDIEEARHAVALMRSLNSMRKEGKDCDLVIKVGSEELSVHRNVVRANSDYLDAMFSHDTLEKDTGIIEMKEVKFEPVKKCIDFFYTGKISGLDEDCEDLLYTASLMQVKPICDKIAPFLESCLGPKTFFKIKKIAAKFDLDALNEVCDNFASEKLGLIVKEKEFNQLSLEYVTFLISSKRVGDHAWEDPKLAVILEWIKYDVENRHCHLIEMMELIDFQQVSPSYGRYLAETEELFFESGKCMKMLYLSSRKSVFGVSPAPAKMVFPSAKEVNSIAVFDVSSKSLQAYFPETKKWRKACSLHEDMLKIDSIDDRYTAVVSDNLVFVLMPDKRFYRQTAESKWEKLGDMLWSHGQYVSAVVSEDQIYVSGSNCMEKYDMNSNEWSLLDSDEVCCEQNTMFQHSGHIYSIGGLKNRQYLKSMHKLTLSSMVWNSEKPMLVGRVTAAVMTTKNNIYVAGGFNGKVLDNVESYDFKTRSWVRLSPMLTGRSCFSLLMVGDKVYAVGKFQDPCDIEEYDCKTDHWSKTEDRQDMKIRAEATVALYL